MPLYGAVNSPTLNLREKPSTESRILVELSKGALVEVIRDAGFGWLQVRVDGTGQEGYVSRIYLNLSDARPSAPATPVPDRPPTQDRQEFPGASAPK
jgi:SH3-like domain-containing protein